MTPANEREQRVFWNYSDVLVFIGLMLPSLALALIAAHLFGYIPGLGKPFRALLAQLIWYALIFAALFGLFKIKYGQPFWRSLGWKYPFTGALGCLLGGPLLALAIGFVGYLIHTPSIKLPFDEMLVDRPTMILFSIFVVALGPLCEELAFRGFIMPLLVETFGAATGIIGTALLFGGLHASEYQWSWRHVLLISVAGAVFGWVRYATGSTTASIFMHSTYNLAQLAGFLASPK